MALYSALVPLMEAHQWFKNGDHPEDRTIHGLNEGRVVQRCHFKHQSDADAICTKCSKPMHQHGFLNYQVYLTLLGNGNRVCPGDYIVTHRNEKDGRVRGYTVYDRTSFEKHYGPYKEPIQ